MRLDEFWIESFKNLKDFHVNFDEEWPYTFLVGENGSGKSNLIESLVWIFRNLDLEEPAPFTYKLKYRLEDSDAIELIAIKDRHPIMTVNTEEKSRAEHAQYLPRFIFGYYSGPSDRLQWYFRKPKERYYTRMKAPGASTSKVPARRLFLAENVHGQFVLMGFYSKYDKGVRDFLSEFLGILDLETVHFVINRPEWADRKSKDKYWGAAGVPRQVIEALEQLSIATTFSRRKLDVSFRRSRGLECWNFLLDQEGFEQLAGQYKTQRDLFQAVESIHISDLLLEVRINVRVRNVDGSISFRELSEGEQQLLTVLGLLRFTKEQDALFLLDEPDTHLNPAWSVQYIDFVERMVGDYQSSHLVIATHDPLVFAGLTKEQVRIMQWSESLEKVVAKKPETDPRGMGVEAILTSDLFKLRAALDLPTLNDLDNRRRLTSKKSRNLEEEIELKRLDRELEDLDFTIEGSDPLYKLFVKAMTEWQKGKHVDSPVLTEAQREEMRLMAENIVKGLKEDFAGQ